MGRGENKTKQNKRQCRIHRYARVCVLITSHTAILKRKIINGSVHQEFRKNWKVYDFFKKVNI